MRMVVAKELLRIEALAMQLPGDKVEVPDAAEVTMSSLGAILHFERGDYNLPRSFVALVDQLMTADILGADMFVQHVSQLLCVHVNLLNLSNDPDSLLKITRDRYRLARKVQLKFPQQDMCYSCKKTLDKDSDVRVKCCGWPFHEKCIRSQKNCPFCKEAWVALPCCVCQKRCDLPLPFHENYNRSRMPCCKADVHIECKTSGECPNCKTSRLPAKDPATFCHTRRVCRETEKQRKQAAQ